MFRHPVAASRECTFFRTVQHWHRSHHQEATQCQTLTFFDRCQIKQNLNLWQLQNTPNAPTVLGHQETVQLVTQKAREARNAVLHLFSIHKENFLLSLINMKRLRLKNLVNIFGKK